MRFATTLVSAALAAAVPARAAVQVTIGGSDYAIGAGYGSGNNRLGVTFSPALTSPTTFSLANVGDSRSLTFGTVTLNDEQDLRPAETVDIAVKVALSLTAPTSGKVESEALVRAYTGAFDDAAVDYSLDFDPVVRAFSTVAGRGSFRLELSDIAFVRDRQSLVQSLTVTLLSFEAAAPPSGEPGTVVPEPGTLALFGGALLGLGVLRRRGRG